MTELWHEWLSDNKALILSGEQPIEFSQWLSIRLSESRQREADLARENAEWREGLKFVQLERDNRTSAYEIGVKLIGELQASNMRLREALNDLLGDCLESGDVPNQPFVKAPHHDSITDAERALAESPSASLEAIRAEAKAEEREACAMIAAKFYSEYGISNGIAKAILESGKSGEKV